MERGIIRKKFQVTIPRYIRRFLSLHVGQTLNWDLSEIEGTWYIRIYGGSCALSSEEAAFRKELLSQPKKRRKRQRLQFGISDTFVSPRGRDKLRAVMVELLGDLGVIQGGSVLKGDRGVDD
jgi:bifunctional DNA-binding transcriptional regulator/antitoxin component of YhaV-PrlF toxin-antitoxin module